jgi:hypothetical protein
MGCHKKKTFMPGFEGRHHKKFFPRTVLLLLFPVSSITAEPIVLNGAMVPELLGAKIASLRVVTSGGKPVPFQIDEVTASGEYVCPQGDSPNADSANGVLDRQDEIVFLFEDIDSAGTPSDMNKPAVEKQRRSRVTIRNGPQARTVFIVADTLPEKPVKSYLEYDQAQQLLCTPYYYAQFGKNRFHFVRAGCMDFTTGMYVDLTNELRVEIKFSALWGLLPIRYTEENIICKVTRYKAGPIRLIRRGDFYLELGLGIRGSKAVVYQLCYPQLVKVPVRTSLPFRFSTFFREAYIEMTPVIRKTATGFRFIVPSTGYPGDLSGKRSIDTLLRVVPKKGYLVTDGDKGFEWVTVLAVDDRLLDGSGYVVRRPSSRNGMAECGFKLVVNDLPKGSYDIINWVFFSRQSPLPGEQQGLKTILKPAAIVTASNTFLNLLSQPSARK